MIPRSSKATMGTKALTLVLISTFSLSLLCWYLRNYIHLMSIPIEALNRNTSHNYYIIAQFHRAGLGNHLWTYASLYGLSKKLHRLPIACSDFSFKNLFEHLSLQINTDKECKENTTLYPKSAPHFEEEKNIHYDTRMIGLLKASQSAYVLVSGYLQNLGYIVEYMDEVKAEFLLKKSYQVTAQQYLHNISHSASKNNQRNNKSLTVGPPVFVLVHVRRGDMLREKGVQVPDQSYFSKAMGHFRTKYGKKVLFVVATNDVKWSKTNIKGNDVHFTADAGVTTREEDFAIGVACNHTVMSVGTFGWWMAVLAGGEVVFYKDWVRGSQSDWYSEGQYFPHYFTPM